MRQKQKKRRVPFGVPVHVAFGVDVNGGYWWRDHARPDLTHGRFRTMAEADKDFITTTFGPDVTEVEETYMGMWDPAWERKQ
jgi:hypothetical protein